MKNKLQLIIPAIGIIAGIFLDPISTRAQGQMEMMGTSLNGGAQNTGTIYKVDNDGNTEFKTEDFREIHHGTLEAQCFEGGLFGT